MNREKNGTGGRIGVYSRRPGRRTQADNDVARLIFSKIGPDFPIKNQLELREKAAIGSSQLTKLRTRPKELPAEVLVALAAAVDVDAKVVLRLVGRKDLANEATVRRMHLWNLEHAQRRNAEESRVDELPEDFFRSLANRANKAPFLLAASFATPPLAPENPQIQDIQLDLLCRNEMCFALVVPAVVEFQGTTPKCKESGALSLRYKTCFESAMSLASSLIHRAAKRSDGKNVADRIAVFALRNKHDSRLLRIVLPPGSIDERSCLVVFNDPTRMFDEKFLIACWTRALDTERGVMHVIHDPGRSLKRPNNPDKREQWRDYFVEVYTSWEKGNFSSFHDLPEDSFWQRIDLRSRE